MKRGSVGHSKFSDAMGAEISMAGPASGMYLMIGKNILPKGLPEKIGGKTVMQLSSNKLLALLPFETYLALKNDIGISHIGPVNVDTERLSRMAQMLTTGGRTAPD
ncbi:hypothetical protein EGM51_04480 [Verrucomicrobia bacterium S94]|nr:hypothetical protein EGM51_04480 [Verrucomicrobia bacterium S94]